MVRIQPPHGPNGLDNRCRAAPEQLWQVVGQLTHQKTELQALGVAARINGGHYCPCMDGVRDVAGKGGRAPCAKDVVHRDAGVNSP